MSANVRTYKGYGITWYYRFCNNESVKQYVAYKKHTVTLYEYSPYFNTKEELHTWIDNKIQTEILLKTVQQEHLIEIDI